MITEDYVSFEVARQLKEKGFNEPTLAYAYGNDMISYYSKPRITDALCVEAGRIPLPTLQMAMKWFRLEHNIHIEPHIVRTRCSYGYMPNYIDLKELESHFPFKEIDFCNLEKYVCITYDKACEATLKYCLENLI